MKIISDLTKQSITITITKLEKGTHIKKDAAFLQGMEMEDPVLFETENPSEFTLYSFKNVTITVAEWGTTYIAIFKDVSDKQFERC